MPPEVVQGLESQSSSSAGSVPSLRDEAPSGASSTPAASGDPGAGAAAAPAAPGSQPDAGTPVPTVADAAATKPTRPDYLPEAYWDAEKGEAKAGALTEALKKLGELEAAQAERAKLVPEKAEGYEPALPEGFKLPDGIEIQLDTNDPVYAAARAFAKERGFTQAEFSSLLELNAQRVVAEHRTLSAAVAAERTKLGENRIARLDAVDSFLKGRLPEAQASALSNMLVTAAQVEAFETLMSSLSGDGVGGFSQKGQGAKATVSEEDWNRMSLEDRINYRRTATGR